MFKKILRGVTDTRAQDRQADAYRNLIRHEAQIGGQVFGPVPAGHRREFFCLDRHTWVWHEEWVDAKGQKQIRTTRYDIRPDSVLKSQNGHYQRASNEEVDRLAAAAKIYRQRIKTELYASLV